MREDPNTAAEMRHNTRSDIYETDIARMETIAAELGALTAALIDLTAKLGRWSAQMIHEPVGVGKAFERLEKATDSMEDARNDIADALSSIENARDGG